MSSPPSSTEATRSSRTMHAVHSAARASKPVVAVAPESVLYVLGRERFVASSKGEMGRVPEGSFAFLSRSARSATDYFGLPPDQVLEVGAHIDL